MAGDLRLVYTGEPLPESLERSIFLAGPTPRSAAVKSWRPEALKILEAKGYKGVVFVPELRSGKALANYDDMVEWEHKAMNRSDCVLFWVPRDLKKLPGFTTNVEFGLTAHSGKVVLGAPFDADKVRYLQFVATKFNIPQADTLGKTIDLALDRVWRGAPRNGGECDVPQHIWHTKSFQSWREAQVKAGNRIDGATLQWVVMVGPKKDCVFYWAMHVNVYVASEDRNKLNEVIASRPDIFAVLLYERGKTPMDTKVVLIKEFRSPASNEKAFIWELPSGSSRDPRLGPLEVAAEEVREEIGLVIPKSRLTDHGARQLAGTFSTHKAHLFSAEISADEMAKLEKQKGIPHGADLENPTGERVYTEIWTVKEILDKQLMDWTMVGMILSALSEK